MTPFQPKQSLDYSFFHFQIADSGAGWILNYLLNYLGITIIKSKFDI